MSHILFKLPLPRGQALSNDDIIEALLDEIQKQTPGSTDYLEMRFELMRYYAMSGNVEGALEIFESLLQADAPARNKARAALVLATGIESLGKYELAISIYRRGLSLMPDSQSKTSDPQTAYFSHNNLAYSLNQIGSFKEGEAEARAAIAVDSTPHNAHKNLGVALEGQRRFVEAARAYIAAVQADPFDPRSLQHLEKMIQAHPETVRDEPGLSARIDLARNARGLLFAKIRDQAMGQPPELPC